MLFAIVIKNGIANDFNLHRFGNDRDFNLGLNLFESTAGRNKYNGICMFTYIAHFDFGGFPNPFTIGVRSKLNRTKQIAIGGDLGYRIRISNTVKRSLFNGNRTLFYLKLNAGVGCLRCDRMYTNHHSIGINDRETNEFGKLLLAHTLKAGNFIFCLGDRFIRLDIITVDLNSNNSFLNDIGTLCFTRVVGIINFKVVAIFTGIGIILIAIRPRNNINVDICLVGRILTRAVVSEISENVDLDLAFCHIYSKLACFENGICTVFNEANVKGSLSGITNGAFGIVKTPSTCGG